MQDIIAFHLAQLGLEDLLGLSILRKIRLNLIIEQHLISDYQDRGIGVSVLNDAI
jgi:hypothetical protein